MLRGAIENRLEYSAAMTNLGVVLQAKNQASRQMDPFKMMDVMGTKN